MDKNRARFEKENRFELIKTAYWFCKAFNFNDITTLNYINSGILGRKKDGTPKTIARSTFIKYKQQLEEMPAIFEDIKKKTTEGYMRLVEQVIYALDKLIEMSGKNVLATDLTPVQRQMIIDSIVTKVLPAKTNTVSTIKKMMEQNQLPQLQELKVIATRDES